MSAESSENNIVILRRDCQALMVPSGARILLQKGMEVTITQALGNTYTVNVYGNLARVDGKDADALGKEAPNPLTELPADAPLEEKIWALLKSVYDPEIPVNIVDLGLIYGCDMIPHEKGQQFIRIKMTLTAPGCGMGPVIAEEVKNKIRALPEVFDVEVELVFDPPWNREMMTETAKLELGVL